MGPNERRRRIIECLSFRRKDTMKNLAQEFGVSWLTIHRDIQQLSEEYPLIVTQGNGGGVSLPDGYYINHVEQRHLTPKQIAVLRRNLNNVSDEDREIFEEILSEFAWQPP